MAGAVFSGVLVNGVDAKGRVSVPHAFRLISEQRLTEAGKTDKVLKIGKHRSWDCLEILDAAEVEVVAASISRRAQEQADKTDEYFDDVHEMLSFDRWSGLAEVTYDSAGRMMLPEPLRKAAKIGDDAVFIGGGSVFYLWNPDAFRAARPNATSVHEQIDEQIAARRRA